MSELNNKLLEIANSVMSDDAIVKIMKEKIEEGITNAINDLFKWGELKNAMKTRVKEVLVPYIEGYNMSDYIVKLDTILSDIVNQTALIDNKTILENFKTLMIEPTEKTVKLSDVIKEWHKFIAKEIDTTGRDVDYEDGVRYKPISTHVYFEEDDDRHWSSFDLGAVDFTVEDEEKDTETKLNRTIRVSRYKNDKDETWRMSYAVEPTINSLRYMNDFDIYLLRLVKADVRLIMDITNDYDEVAPENESEVHYV